MCVLVSVRVLRLCGRFQIRHKRVQEGLLGILGTVITMERGWRGRKGGGVRIIGNGGNVEEGGGGGGGERERNVRNIGRRLRRCVGSVRGYIIFIVFEVFFCFVYF